MTLDQLPAALASLSFASAAVLLVLGVASKAHYREEYSNLDDLEDIFDDEEGGEL